MRVPDILAPSELRLAALLFGLALAGYGVRAGRHLSPEIARWIDDAERTAAESTGTGGRGADPAPARPAGGGADSLPPVVPPLPPPPVGSPRSARARGAVRGAGGPVDPNRAGAAELVTLPGVGPVLARRIVEERERSGGFRAPEDLLRVRGIGRATLERLRPLLRFPPDPPRGTGNPPGGEGAPPVGSSEPTGGG